MTLVEVLVAVLIIAVVLVPFGVVFYNTLNASAANGARQDAALVATSILSKLDSSPYSEVGFTSSTLQSAAASDPSYATATTTGGATTYSWTPNLDQDTSSEQLVTVTTQPTFTVGAAGTAFAPVMTGVTAGHTVFTVYTHILEASAEQLACSGTTTLSDAYIRVFVQVSWRYSGSSIANLFQDKLIYPGGLNPVSNTEAPPSAPQGVSATPQTVGGEVVVKWTLPANWTPSTSCFKVGWADTNQNEYSSGFLTEPSSASTCPTPVPSTPVTYFTVSGSTASYCVTSLQQGGSSQAYDFYVTAYTPDATQSNESTNVAANAPQGPTITDVAPSNGTAGSSIVLTGSQFATSSQLFEFCSATVVCTSSFSANCSTATTYCESENCASTTSCTVTAPTLSGAATSGVYYIVAETSTTPVITSAPQAVTQFTYTPTLTAITPSLGPSGSTVTIIGTNLYGSFTAFDFSGVGATGVTCNAGGGSCSMTVPDDSSGNPILIGTATVTAVDNSVSSSNSLTYTY